MPVFKWLPQFLNGKICHFILRNMYLKCMFTFSSPAHLYSWNRLASEAVSDLKQLHLLPWLSTSYLTWTPNNLPPQHTDCCGCCCPHCHHVLTFAAFACHTLIKCHLMAPQGPKQANTLIWSVWLVKKKPLPSPLCQHLWWLKGSFCLFLSSLCFCLCKFTYLDV